jgi:hypothetical protein
MSCQNPTSSDLPGRPNATIRSPAVARTRNQGPGRGTGAFAVIDALICRYLFALTGETAMPRPYGRGGALRFRSLRLSVRTPPFHGGESGSIPLGSAIYFNGLAPTPVIDVFDIASPRGEPGVAPKYQRAAKSGIREDIL